MAELNNNYINNSQIDSKLYADDSANLNAHYSKNMKVKRPSVNPDRVATIIPVTKLYDANKKFQEVNDDIFTSYQKEKSSYEFNFKTYFKIFCAVILAAGGFAGIRFLKNFFKRR